MNLKILQIQVLVRPHHPDLVSFDLDDEVSSPFPVFGDRASVSTLVQAGYGLAWVQENFPGVPVLVEEHSQLGSKESG